jgi:hypothetical protein
MYISRYLILKDETFTQLCLLNLFIKVIFLLKKTITKIETRIKLIGKKSNDVLPAEIDDTSSDLPNFQPL